MGQKTLVQITKKDGSNVLLPSNDNQVQVVRNDAAFGSGKYYAYFSDGTREEIGGPDSNSYARLYYEGVGYQLQGINNWQKLTFTAIENNTPDITLNADNQSIEFAKAGKYKIDFNIFGKTTDFENFSFSGALRNDGIIDDKNHFEDKFDDIAPIHELSGSTILDIAANKVVTLESFTFNEPIQIGNGFCGLSVTILKID